MSADFRRKLIRFLLATTFVVLLSEPCRGSENANSCSSDERACIDGACVYEKWWCDGDEDCSAGEDERNCPERNCSLTEFRCTSGQCIQDILKCDGNEDCEDISDEHDCDEQLVKSCALGQYMCVDQKRCIRSAWLCDGKSDCLDQSDETAHQCGTKLCEETQFACHSGHQCIVGRWQCDGQKDCADGSDEDCPEEDVCDLDHGQYQCSDGKTCVSLANVCDGKTHCPEGEDEGSLCESSCDENTCDHKCLPMPTGPICMCSHGYKLKSDKRTCIDLDECNDVGGKVCSQICTNIPGSYYCECHSGYRLQPDKHTCKVVEPNPVLLYAQTQEVHSINLHTLEVKSLVTGRKNISDIAYDHVGTKGTLFWADDDDTSILQTYLDYALTGHVLPAVTVGLVHPRCLDVDWLSAMLYITDSGRKQIIGCRMSGDSCTILLTLGNDDVPLSIVVDPLRGVMYWTSVGHPPYIAKGSMDGSEWAMIVTKDLGYPASLFLDDTTERLYWADRDLHKISSVNYNGTERQTVLESRVESPQSVVVFEDKVIWTDLNSGSILMANKFTGKGQTTLLKSMSEPRSLHLAHPVFTPTKVLPCHSSSQVCNSFCLLSDNEAGYSCACPIGYHLNPNTSLCQDSHTSPFLIVGHQDAIIKVDMNYIGKRPYKIYQVPSVEKIVALDFDPYREAAIYSDAVRGVIGARKLFSLDAPSEEVIIEGLLGDVISLAVDWIAGNLYWIDSKKGYVEVARLDGSFPVSLDNPFSGSPAALALDPPNGKLYYSIKGDNPSIIGCDLSGLDCVDVVRVIKDCLGIAVAGGTLYWSDTELGHIGSANLDGSDPKILINGLTSPLTLAVQGDVMYWLDSTDELHKYSLSGHTAERSVPTSWSGLAGLALIDWKKFSSGSNACGNNNGGCSHLCLAQGSQRRTCRCPRHLELKDDGKTCTEFTPECKDDQLVCDQVKCIDQSLRCDGVQHCEDDADELDCVGNYKVDCSKDEFKCKKDGKDFCILKSWVCDHDPDCDDKSDEKDCKYTCAPDEITCDNGECVFSSSVCDGNVDCEDGSDELNCSDVTTPPSETCPDAFECTTGECVDTSQLCDGTEDCMFGEDEIPENCHQIHPEMTCSSAEFTCTNGYCIDLVLRCDTNRDCDDNSDEDATMCAAISTTELPARQEFCLEGTYRCSSGHCLLYSDVCDGKSDCTDGSDEGELCDSACSPSKCSHVCNATPSGPVCSCPPGYNQLSDNVTCQDLDECAATPPPCSQTCKNTNGSFLCSCAPGYILMLDGTRCKAEGARPTILLGRHREIVRLTEDGQHMYEVLPDLKGSVKSVDVDIESGDVYWTNSLGSVFKWSENEVDSPKLTVAHASNVAYDWLTGNLYITDIGRLIACSKNLSWCRIILHLGMKKPRGLALYPNKGLMFWIIGGASSSLVRSWMTGERQKPILTERLTRPASVSIDYVLDRVYFVDNFRQTMESCDFNGNHRQTFKDLGAPFSIDTFEDWAYITDTQKKALVRIHKDFTGRFELVHTRLATPTCLKIIHPLRQPKGQNPCEKSQCSHLCLLTPSGGKCACPIGYFFQEKSNTNCSNCSSYCQNGGVCTPQGEHLTCVCLPEYKGEQCQTPMGKFASLSPQTPVTKLPVNANQTPIPTSLEQSTVISPKFHKTSEPASPRLITVIKTKPTPTLNYVKYGTQTLLPISTVKEKILNLGKSDLSSAENIFNKSTADPVNAKSGKKQIEKDHIPETSTPVSEPLHFQKHKPISKGSGFKGAGKVHFEKPASTQPPATETLTRTSKTIQTDSYIKSHYSNSKTGLPSKPDSPNSKTDSSSSQDSSSKSKTDSSSSQHSSKSKIHSSKTKTYSSSNQDSFSESKTDSSSSQHSSKSKTDSSSNQDSSSKSKTDSSSSQHSSKSKIHSSKSKTYSSSNQHPSSKSKTDSSSKSVSLEKLTPMPNHANRKGLEKLTPTPNDEKVTPATKLVPVLISLPIPVQSSVPPVNENRTRTPSSQSDEGGNTGVAVGVTVTLLVLVAVLLTVVVILWKRGKKPSLAKLVWYHKGKPSHKKIEDQEELVPGRGIQNPVYEEEQSDINFNIGKGSVLRYPSDSSIDSAFISTGNGKPFDDYTGSTCQLLPQESV